MTKLTEARLGGYSLLSGTVAVAVASALSPGRGMVDTVPSTSLSDLTLAMGRNDTLSYALAVVIVLAALLMLNGIVTLRRYAAPVPRLGLLGMTVGVVLQMVMRGFDYMLVGFGRAALGSDPEQAAQSLATALAMQRTVWGLHFTGSVAGYAGIAVLAFGLISRPEPLRLPPVLNGIVAVLTLVALALFIAAWHSDALELSLAPVFALTSASSIVYMGLLGWRLAVSGAGDPPAD